MGLKDYLGRRATQRMLAPEDALNICLLAARGQDDDQAAFESVREKLAKVSGDEIRHTVVEWDQRRADLGDRDFVDDRAYRLLLAYYSGTEVLPIAAENRDQFEQEARIGRVPLPVAFAELATAEPRLRDLEADPKRGRRVNRVKQLIGPESGNDDPLLSSRTAFSIAVQYLWRPATERDKDQRSYFERPYHESRGSFRLETPTSP